MKVELIDHMGSDLSVVNAARVSFDKESEWDSTCQCDCAEHGGSPGPDCEYCDNRLSNQDQKLITYLAKHNHWTPFAHCFASFRIKAPIFVARQLGKHQVGLVWNEVSRRYVDSPPEFYTPERWRKKAENVKQGSSPARCENHGDVQSDYGWLISSAENIYDNMIRNGVCAEQARMVLPQSMYTEWIWSGSLVAFSRVVKLRTDPHTQLETQAIAMQIDAALENLFPHSWKAITNG